MGFSGAKWSFSSTVKGIGDLIDFILSKFLMNRDTDDYLMSRDTDDILVTRN